MPRTHLQRLDLKGSVRDDRTQVQDGRRVLLPQEIEKTHKYEGDR